MFFKASHCSVYALVLEIGWRLFAASQISSKITKSTGYGGPFGPCKTFVIFETSHCKNSFFKKKNSLKNVSENLFKKKKKNFLIGDFFEKECSWKMKMQHMNLQHGSFAKFSGKNKKYFLKKVFWNVFVFCEKNFAVIFSKHVAGTRVENFLIGLQKVLNTFYFVFRKEYLIKFLLQCNSAFLHLSWNMLLVMLIAEF